MKQAIHCPRNILVTGGAGFIGCNLVRHLLSVHRDVRVIVLDSLTYAGSLKNLDGLDASHGDRYCFVQGDINDLPLVSKVLVDQDIDTIIHLAAESHVDRSIDDPLCFIRTNVLGTGVLLHAARQHWRGRPAEGEGSVRFHSVSTDEVFGSLGESGHFTEDTAYDPSSPYSASKAGSDHLVRAWARTYRLPVTISNCSNNYGPFQFPEKLIPLMISHALAGKQLPVYGNGLNVRDWLYVEDHVRAIDCIIRHGKMGETYCIGGNNEHSNIEIVKILCRILDERQPDPIGSYERLIAYVADRPGHDLRYAINAEKIRLDLDWVPQESFGTGIVKTIAWYLANKQWLSDIRQDQSRRLVNSQKT